MTRSHTATCYAVVHAVRQRYGPRDNDTGLRSVDSIKVDRITQNYPASIPPDTVVVKLQLEVPDAAFAPLLPNAVIAVPESMIDQPVHVEAVPASEDPR